MGGYMRRITYMMSRFKADAKEGESLHFEQCKGGYFSTKDEFGLKVVGKTEQDGTPTPDTPVPIQCVKAGTVIEAYGENYVKITSSKTSNGITYTPNDNGSIVINGTSTDWSTSAKMTVTLEAGTYTKREIVSPNSKISLTAKSGQNYFYGTFTLSEPTTIDFYIQVKPDTTVENFVVFPLCFKGTAPVATATVPCDLYESDIWYPMTGKVERNTKVVDLSTKTILNLDASTSSLNRFYISEQHDTAYSGFSSNMKKHNWATDNDSFDASVNSNLIYFNISARLTEYSGGAAASYISEQTANGNPFLILVKMPSSVVEQYDPEPIFAPSGTVNVIQTPVDLTADMYAVMPTRR